MPASYKAVIAHLMQKNEKDSDLCCLCFKRVEADAISVNDEVTVTLEANGNYTSECMTEVLINILGVKVIQITAMFPAICKPCATSVISSYKFKKTVQSNIDNIALALEDLGNCFENVSDPEEFGYKSIFVSVKPQEKTIQQFYDERKQLEPSAEMALARFKFISDGVTGLANPLKRRNRDFSTIFIKTHELLADPSKPREFRCKMCFKECTSQGSLRQHFFSKHFKKDYQCSLCSKQFGTFGILQTHMHQSHVTVNCKDCGKQLLNRPSTIKRHAITHLRRRQICSRCGKSYKKQQEYERHIARDTCLVPSKTPGDYSCDACGYRCNYKNQLLLHIKFEHVGVEGHVCQWCQKKYYSASALKTHVLKHTKERNFVCPECGGKFVTKQSLVNHQRLHSGEKPYPCEHCDQSFLSASRRKDHYERCHSKDTFDCDLCDCKYNARRSLVKHRKRHFIEEEE